MNLSPKGHAYMKISRVNFCACIWGVLKVRIENPSLLLPSLEENISGEVVANSGQVFILTSCLNFDDFKPHARSIHTTHSATYSPSLTVS